MSLWFGILNTEYGMLNLRVLDFESAVEDFISRVLDFKTAFENFMLEVLDFKFVVQDLSLYIGI